MFCVLRVHSCFLDMPARMLSISQPRKLKYTACVIFVILLFHSNTELSRVAVASWVRWFHILSLHSRKHATALYTTECMLAGT